MAEPNLQFGKRTLRKISGKSDAQIEADEQVRRAMSLVASQSRLANKILKENEKQIKKSAEHNESVRNKLEKVVEGQVKADEIGKKIQEGASVSKKQAKFFLEHQKRLSKMMEESEVQVAANFNDIADQYKELVSNEKVSEETRREMLEDFQQMLQNEDIQQQMSSQQLKATERLLAIDTKTMQFNEDMKRDLNFLHNNLSDNTTDIKIKDTLSGIQKQNESILYDEDKLNDLLDKQTSSGQSVGKSFSDSGLGKTLQGGVLDFATMGLASSLGINDFSDISALGGMAKGLPDKFKSLGKHLGKFGGSLSKAAPLLKGFGAAAGVAAAGMIGWEIGSWLDKKFGKDIDKALFGGLYDKWDKDAASLSGDSALNIMKASKGGVFGDEIKTLASDDNNKAIIVYERAKKAGKSEKEALAEVRELLQRRKLHAVLGDRSLSYQEQMKKREKLKKKFKDDEEKLSDVTERYLSGDGTKQLGKLKKAKLSMSSSDALSTSLMSAASGYEGKALDYSKMYPEGKAPKTSTQEEAKAQFEKDYAQTETKVKGMLKSEPNEGQLAALTSFAQSVGVDKFSKSTLLKKYNSGDVAGAANEFNSWVKAGGVVSSDLIARRQKEKGAFLSEGTNVDVTPVGEGSVTSSKGKLESSSETGMSTEALEQSKMTEEERAKGRAELKKAMEVIKVLPAVIASSGRSVEQKKPDRSTNIEDVVTMTSGQVVGQ